MRVAGEPLGQAPPAAAVRCPTRARTIGTATLADAVRGRRSSRSFGALPLALERSRDAAPATAYGVTATESTGHRRRSRAAPVKEQCSVSTQAVRRCLHDRIEVLEVALYHYDPSYRLESLEPLTEHAGGEPDPLGRGHLRQRGRGCSDDGPCSGGHATKSARARVPLHAHGGWARHPDLLLAATALGLACVPVSGLLRPQGQQSRRSRRHLWRFALPRAGGARGRESSCHARAAGRVGRPGDRGHAGRAGCRAAGPSSLETPTEALAAGCLAGAAGFVVIARRRIPASSARRRAPRASPCARRRADPRSTGRGGGDLASAAVLGALLRPRGGTSERSPRAPALRS